MKPKKKSPAAQFPVSWTVFDGPDGFAAQIVRVTNEGKDNQQTENIALVHHEGNVPLISAALDLLTMLKGALSYGKTETAWRIWEKMARELVRKIDGGKP